MGGAGIVVAITVADGRLKALGGLSAARVLRRCVVAFGLSGDR